MTLLIIRLASGEMNAGVIDHLSTAVNEASELRILHAPYRLQTRARMSPEGLRSSAQFHKTISRAESPQVFIALKDALAQTRAAQPSGPASLYWGCLICAKDGTVLGSIYLEGKFYNRAGRRGLFNGNPLDVNLALFEWFEHSFPEATRM